MQGMRICIYLISVTLTRWVCGRVFLMWTRLVASLNRRRSRRWLWLRCVSGKTLPLLGRQALQLTRHDICEIKPQTVAHRWAHTRARALRHRIAGVGWHQRGWWHLEVTRQVHGGL